MNYLWEKGPPSAFPIDVGNFPIYLSRPCFARGDCSKGKPLTDEPRMSGFRSAILAIAGMIVVAGAGAAFSYLLIARGVAATSFRGVAERSPSGDGWMWPGDAVDRFVSTQLFRDVADWTGFEDSFETADPGGPDAAEFLDPITAAEIAFPLLVILTVVAAAQRLAEFGPVRGGRDGSGDGRERT